LDWAQEIPMLEPDDDPDFALEPVATAVVRDPDSEQLAVSGTTGHYGATFPATPLTPSHPDYLDWLSLHDETTLEAWLADLSL
jgi:hypothetical protein